MVTAKPITAERLPRARSVSSANSIGGETESHGTWLFEDIGDRAGCKAINYRTGTLRAARPGACAGALDERPILPPAMFESTTGPHAASDDAKAGNERGRQLMRP